jgi:hypothetical protein
MDRKQRREEARKHDHNMYVTRIEVLCQNTGRTFQIETRQPVMKKTCWCCNKENFEVHLGEGKGNIVVYYIDAIGTRRELDKIIPDEHTFGLAQYDSSGGSFLLLSQTLP